MFDILDFIDSPDIREYNKNTEFTPAEQAVLITMSNHRTLEEKKAALQELVDAYNEEEFHTERILVNKVYGTFATFRQLVLDTIKWWDRLLAERYNAENMVYMARFKEKEIRNDGDELFFSSYDKAYEYIVSKKTYYRDNPKWKGIELCAHISRIHLDCADRTDFTRYDFDHEMRLIHIRPCYNCGEKPVNLEEAFYVHVPMPFKCGDFIKVESPFLPTYYGVMPGDSRSRENDFCLKLGSGDGTDMIEWLDVYDSDRGIDWTDDTSVLAMRYAKEEEIPEDEQELKKISECRKAGWEWDELVREFGKQRTRKDD